MHAEQSNEQNVPTAWILPKGLRQEDFTKAILTFASKNPGFRGGWYIAPGCNSEEIKHVLPANYDGGKQLTADDCASLVAETSPTKEQLADEPNIVYINGCKVLVTSSEIGDSSDVLIPF
jgi:hypothetical protein